MVRAILSLIRVHQWLKNLFLFVPAFFGGTLHNYGQLEQLIYAFFTFSVVASAVYIFNDYQDRNEDRQHPIKSKRPLASGKISFRVAFICFFILLSGGLGVSYLIDIHFFYLLLLYFVVNLSYSIRLKQLPLLDITLISFGFIIRVLAGSQVSDTPLSKWLIIMVFLLALFLAIAKRRDDVRILESGKVVLRKSLYGYSIRFIDTLLSIFSSIIILSYLMYTIDEATVQLYKTDYIYLTSLWVVFGVIRYLQLTIVENKSGSPTAVLLKDRVLQFILFSWITHFLFIVYL